MLRYVFFASVLMLSCFADCPDGKKQYRVTLRHIESGGIGYDNGYTTLEAFFASDPGQWSVTPFFDARGHVLDSGKWAANVGFGVRSLCGGRVYGMNTYYDYRNVNHLSSNQVGVGFETLGTLFDFRLNGYLPVGAKTSRPFHSSFGTFDGNHLLISQRVQSAMKGANAEFGFHLGRSKSFDFYTAIGPYYFIGKYAPATWGGKARILGTYKDIVTLEFSDSYDRTFHNKFQGQISLSYSFGPNSTGRRCALNDRMLQPVDRFEIIVIDKARKKTVAIDPATGLPYFFVFVDNTSSSNGTFESPYHSLAQAQTNSKPNDIIYVFPGDGTTTGMDSGITLQENQKFWGSGIDHLLQTSVGTISIPQQSSSFPTITNANFDTDGNAVTLAANNAISGFVITSALNDAIYGTDSKNLEVLSCIFENTSTFPIEASCLGNASILVANNQFLNNVNGIFLTLNGTSTFVCSDNTFTGQTSVSSTPVELAANSNSFSANIENNVFNNNTTGSIRANFTDVVAANFTVLNNTITNNGTGAQGIGLGSSFVIIPNGTTENCSIAVKDNTFSNNASHSLYLHTSGAFTTLAVTASTNAMSDNGGSALVLATAVDTLTLLVSDNTITNLGDNGIAIISNTPSTTGTITVNNNTITGIANASNAIAISQGFSNLNLNVLNNEINECEGTGLLCFSTEFTNMVADISGNMFSNCQNTGGGNAASGVSLDTYLTLNSTISNNIFSNDVAPGVAIGAFTSGNPNICLTLTGNNSNTDPSYVLTNPGSGVFNLTPCNVDSVNVGMIDMTGAIDLVQSCSNPTPCPP